MLRWMNSCAIRQLRPCTALLRAHVLGVSGNGNVKVTAVLSRLTSSKTYNVPPSSEFVARVSGIATMAKLPYQDTAEGLDAAFIGVPIDTGTSNRPGTRFAHAPITLISFFSHFFFSPCCCQKPCTVSSWHRKHCAYAKRILPEISLNLKYLLISQLNGLRDCLYFAAYSKMKCSIDHYYYYKKERKLKTMFHLNSVSKGIHDLLHEHCAHRECNCPLTCFIQFCYQMLSKSTWSV